MSMQSPFSGGRLIDWERFSRVTTIIGLIADVIAISVWLGATRRAQEVSTSPLQQKYQGPPETALVLTSLVLVYGFGYLSWSIYSRWGAKRSRRPSVVFASCVAVGGMFLPIVWLWMAAFIDGPALQRDLAPFLHVSLVEVMSQSFAPSLLITLLLVVLVFVVLSFLADVVFGREPWMIHGRSPTFFDWLFHPFETGDYALAWFRQLSQKLRKEELNLQELQEIDEQKLRTDGIKALSQVLDKISEARGKESR